MAEWIYRATAKRAGWVPTVESLTDFEFLCRTVYKKNGHLIPNVDKVRSDDLIHVAFSAKQGDGTLLEGIGSFQVLAVARKDLGGRVTHEKSDDMCLFTVRPGTDLEKLLAAAKYKPDPQLGEFTGWHVREVEKREIEFTKDLFPGNNALHEWPPGAADKATLVPAQPKPTAPKVSPAASPNLQRKPLTLPASGSALGIDWSGAAKAGKKVWAARIEFGGTAGSRLTFVQRPFSHKPKAADVAADFAGWLQTQRLDVAGLDFCFGVSREHALEGMLTDGPSTLGPWLAKHYPTPERFKVALGREIKRKTDRDRNSPFAPTNLRMYRQTYWGIRALSGVRPILPWNPVGPRAVVEILPAHIVSKLCPRCRYKGRTQEAMDERRAACSTCCETSVVSRSLPNKRRPSSETRRGMPSMQFWRRLPQEPQGVMASAEYRATRPLAVRAGSIRLHELPKTLLPTRRDRP